MNVKLTSFFFCLFSFLCLAQVDEIKFDIRYEANSKLLEVEQTMQLHRDTLSNVFYFYVWANSYKDRTTTLSEVKINQRNDLLHFAALEERGWIENLHLTYENDSGVEKKLPFSFEENELIKVYVPKRKILNIKAHYKVHLPSHKFTGYGIDKDGNLLLKYFFIHPEVRENGNLVKQEYKDFESLTTKEVNYVLNLDVPNDFEVYTDLKRHDLFQYIGQKRGFFELAIQKKGTNKYIWTPYGMVIFDHEFPIEDEVLLQKTISNQLEFLSDRLGKINEPLFISGKRYRKNKLDGVEDIYIPIINKTYKIFFPEDRIKMEMIAQLSAAFMDRKVLVHMNQDHWLRHGLAHYLFLEYMDKELNYIPVVGNIPEDFKVINYKPLKHLAASRILMKDRSAWAYKILMQSNFSQSIQTPFDELSNMNQEMISGVKAGLCLQYLADYIGKEKFNSILKNWISNNNELSAKKFQSILQNHVTQDTDWFFKDLISRESWYDIGIQRVKKTVDSTTIYIKTVGNVSVPFKLSAEGEEGNFSKWIDNDNSNISVELANNNYHTFHINKGIKLPDFKSKNDFYKTDVWFSKPIKVGLVTDVPEANKTQIFLIPEVSWNNYDKLQLGLSMTNRTPLPQSWVYKFKPQYSFGEGHVTGNFLLARNIYPRKRFFRKVNFNLGTSYQHYDRGLAYKRLSFGMDAEFTKKARSTRNRTVYAFYQQIDREVRESASEELKELKDYGLFNMGYRYWNTHLIHERKMWLNLQISNTFSKLMGEYYYRWKYSKDKIIGVRLFAGAFVSHDLNHAELFDFGLDRISDYTFSYPLLGRSENDGILSQQYVLAEGGFKSNFYKKSNQLLFTTNWELPVWRFIDSYVDFGYLKDKDLKGEFLYDSGFKFKIIPDFIELYFPIQSSLGFEPGLGAYHKRVRFMLNLDFNKFMDYWRRGKN